jgi:hypothetical protein
MLSSCIAIEEEKNKQANNTDTLKKRKANKEDNNARLRDKKTREMIHSLLKHRGWRRRRDHGRWRQRRRLVDSRGCHGCGEAGKVVMLDDGHAL